MKIELPGGKTRLKGGVQLAPGYNIRTEALLVNNLIDAFAAKGFAGIQHHPVLGIVQIQRMLQRPTVCADRILVHYVQRRAVFGRKGHRIHAADGQMAVFVHARDCFLPHCYPSKAN